VNGKKLFPLSTKTGNVIIFCLVRAIADLRGRWKINAGSGIMLNSKKIPKIVLEKPHFIYKESLVKTTRMESETL
jgi:hypothetical protein